MQTPIKYYKREVYGNAYNYIIDPLKAKHVQNITQRKTITSSDMHNFTALGISFEQVIQPAS